jgi:hypothetical protein
VSADEFTARVNEFLGWHWVVCGHCGRGVGSTKGAADASAAARDCGWHAFEEQTLCTLCFATMMRAVRKDDDDAEG